MEICPAFTVTDDRALQFLFPRLFGGTGAAGGLARNSKVLTDPVDIQDMEPAVANNPNDVYPWLSPTEYVGNLTTASSCRAYFYWLQWAVYAAATSPHTSNVQALFRLVSNEDQGRAGGVYARTVVYTASDEQLTRGLRFLTPKEKNEVPIFPPGSPPGLLQLDSDRNSAVAAAATGPSEDDDGQEGGEPPTKTRRLLEEAAVAALPGELVYLKSGDAKYDAAMVQYASYQNSYPPECFQPFRVVRPQNESQVIEVVQYAINNGKKVVTRSGGHQYCGYSSGDQRYVQIIMDNFMKDQDITLSTEPVAEVRRRGCTMVSPDRSE